MSMSAKGPDVASRGGARKNPKRVAAAKGAWRRRKSEAEEINRLQAELDTTLRGLVNDTRRGSLRF